MTSLNRQLELEPRSPDAMEELGRALSMLGRISEAEQALNQVTSCPAYRARYGYE